jgi:hypothetical protein
VGTVDHSEYLRDETGGRRFWPVTVKSAIDVEGLRRDRDQLWAEAVERYRKGDKWWLETEDLTKAAAEEQEARYNQHPWETKVIGWLENPVYFVREGKEDVPVPVDISGGVTIAMLLEYAVKKPSGQWGRADEMQMGGILRRLGWKPMPGRQRPRVYARTLLASQPNQLQQGG